MPSREKLSEFTAWCRQHVTGDEKGQAQIILDRLFQAFGQPGCLDVGGSPEFRIRKADEDGRGTAFASRSAIRFTFSRINPYSSSSIFASATRRKSSSGVES